VQIGSNTNLVDWTYVTNVVKAHLLAVDKLSSPKVLYKEEMLDLSLPTISCSTGERRVPTSLARPIGPALTTPPDADKLVAAFALPREAEERAFVRSKFDPLGPSSLEREEAEGHPLEVAGQVFNITNGEPVYFWDPVRTLMLGIGAPREDVDRGRWVLPQTIGSIFAWAAEWMSWLTGKEPTFTQLRVKYMCAARHYNIEKARRVLGYEPDVGMKEGIERTIEVRRSINGNMPNDKLTWLVISGGDPPKPSRWSRSNNAGLPS
jgi:sterol-4alpha-carboxylate 3-dehydrogenase (decarboxylating)